MMYYLKSDLFDVEYEVRTGSGMTTINVQHDGKDIDCITINGNITQDEVWDHIEEWERNRVNELIG